jgi:hypothetical protein
MDKLKYNTKPADERFDFVSEIGYVPNYTYEFTDEPFRINDVEYWRWDKNIEQWVEGEIDEETGEWKLKSK